MKITLELPKNLVCGYLVVTWRSKSGVPYIMTKYLDDDLKEGAVVKVEEEKDESNRCGCADS